MFGGLISDGLDAMRIHMCTNTCIASWMWHFLQKVVVKAMRSASHDALATMLT